MDTKECSKCGEEKPLTEYHKAKTCRDGLRGECKPCYREKIKAHYRKNRQEYLARSKRYSEKNKERISEYHRKRRPEISDRLNEYASQYRKANRDKCSELARKHREMNPEKSAANTAKYRAAKLQQTASWANDQLIAAYYKEAKRLEELTGIQFHVDHIIPLQGELVSGLHVETNLQLLPAHENIGKSNRFDPELFAA